MQYSKYIWKYEAGEDLKFYRVEYTDGSIYTCWATSKDEAAVKAANLSKCGYTIFND